MNRISGFAFLTGVKKMKVKDIMYRVNDRKAMKERKEDEALTAIALYLDK